MLHVRTIAAPPDPVALARALAGRPGLALLHDADPASRPRRSYVACDPVEVSDALVPEPGEPAKPDDPHARAPRWIGAIPYEAGRFLERSAWTRRPDGRPPPHLPRPAWRRYAAVAAIDHDSGLVAAVGDDASAVQDLAARLERDACAPGSLVARLLDDDDPPLAHLARVRAALARIAAGDLYQVNLARRLRVSVSGRAIDAYARLAEASGARYGACLDFDGVSVCATSPELFLEVTGGFVLTAPIEGTRPRGTDPADDARQVAELESDPKERAELAMIVDVERNDLGRIAETGSVSVLATPHVVTHRTVHHRLAIVGAKVASGCSLADVLAATFPSGSVTGAPKIRAMELIAELEPARRGLYTGAYGSIAHDGSLRLAMAIRVLTIREGEGHYFAGGGIVADSDPERELVETGWKAVQLRRLVEE